MCNNKTNLKYLRKSRCNSSSKAKNQMFKAEIFSVIKFLFSGNGLLSVFRETELQIDQNIILKKEAHELNYVFENNYFQKSYPT